MSPSAALVHAGDSGSQNDLRTLDAQLREVKSRLPVHVTEVHALALPRLDVLLLLDL